MATTSRNLPIITICIIFALYATLSNISLHHRIWQKYIISDDGTGLEDGKEIAAMVKIDSSPVMSFDIVKDDNVNVTKLGRINDDNNNATFPNDYTKPKPRLIIHVGPPKMASTTVQCGLEHYGYHLINDNYYYLGKRCIGKKLKEGYQSTVTMIETHPIASDIKHNTIRRMSNPNATTHSLTGHIRSLIKELSYHYERNHSVILSDEAFHDLVCSSSTMSRALAFRAIIGQWEWQSIDIIVNYRRYSDWITSVYPRQLNSTHSRKKLSWKKWEDQGGYVPPTLVDYVRGTFPPSSINNVDGYDEWMFALPSTHAHRAWSSLFSNVILFNLYQPGEMAANFICDAIPHATTSCIVARNNRLADRNTNHKFFDYRFDLHVIINAARKMGLIGNRTLGRVEVFRKTQDRFKASLLDGMEMSCLDGKERRLVYDMTVAIERHMFPEWYEEEMGKGNYGDLKDKIGNSTKYCGLDVEAVLRNQTWRDFFRNLT